MPFISGLVTTAALDREIGEVENNIPSTSDLVKKMDYDGRKSETETKHFTTSDYDKFTSEILDPKMKENGLVDKSDTSGFKI